MSQNKKDYSRREFLKNSLALAGTLGFRSFLLGLPPSFLASRAMAAGPATYLIYSTFSEGCPVNANVPGSYIPGITHPGSLNTPVSFSLGTTTVQGGAPWANLPAALRARLQFLHHDSRTNSHAEGENVMKAHGAIKSSSGNGAEMLPSAIGQITKSTLGTLSDSPALVASIGSNLTANSIPQPLLAPRSITQIFPTSVTATTTSLRQFRDQALDSLYRDVRTNGTTAQRKFMDDHVISAQQARNLAGEFQTTLSGLGVSREKDQIIAACALIAAKVSPSIVVSLPFGRDNHSASGTEEADTIASCDVLAFLWDRLNSMGLANQTTFCLQNVFGRSPIANAAGGRGHWGAHNVAVMFGPNVKPGVTGSVKISGTQGYSTGINSVTGSATSPDVPTTETLGAVAKTVMKACGVDDTTIDQRVSLGKILRSAVV